MLGNDVDSASPFEGSAIPSTSLGCIGSNSRVVLSSPRLNVTREDGLSVSIESVRTEGDQRLVRWRVGWLAQSLRWSPTLRCRLPESQLASTAPLQACSAREQFGSPPTNCNSIVSGLGEIKLCRVYTLYS